MPLVKKKLSFHMEGSTSVELFGVVCNSAHLRLYCIFFPSDALFSFFSQDGGLTKKKPIFPTSVGVGGVNPSPQKHLCLQEL